MVKIEASAWVGGVRFGAWRPDPTTPGLGAAPEMVAAHTLWLVALSAATSAGAGANDDGQWWP